MGIFGNPASIIIDLNLVVQYVTLILLLFGYIKRRSLKVHGRIMSTVTLITLVTILLIMAPSFVRGFGTFEPTIVFHAGLGLLATLLGVTFSFRFNKALRTSQPLSCGTKNMMRLAFVLWILPILGGTYLYITRYVLL